MRIYGLIGQSLGHSFSKRYFEDKFAHEQRFDCRYELFELPTIEHLTLLIEQHPDLIGFNVTIPYKQQIIPYLDEIDPEALRVGAVNTVRVTRADGKFKLFGYNTDIEGFRKSLVGQPLPAAALVLGSGGAAAAVTFVLRQWNVPYKIVSRRPHNEQLLYEQLTPAILTTHTWIINCTPVGMFPNVESKPSLPYEALTPQHFLYDLTYNPSVTAFLKEGAKRNCRTQNGLQMLYLQADAAWRIWAV